MQEPTAPATDAHKAFFANLPPYRELSIEDARSLLTPETGLIWHLIRDRGYRDGQNPNGSRYVLVPEQDCLDAETEAAIDYLTNPVDDPAEYVSGQGQGADLALNDPYRSGLGPNDPGPGGLDWI